MDGLVLSPNPNTGGDLAAAIALLAQTLATQNIHPQPTPNTPAVPVTSLTRLQEPDSVAAPKASSQLVALVKWAHSRFKEAA